MTLALLFAALAAAPAFAQDAPETRPLTLDDLYGSDPLDLAGRAPRGFVWVSADNYSDPAKGELVDAGSGERTAAFEKTAVADALTGAGVAAGAAKAVAGSPGRATWNGDYSRALVADGGDLFLLSFPGPAFGAGADADAKPTAVRLTETPARERLPALAPDGRAVAFVRDFDLYAVPLIGEGAAMTAGPEVRLTTGGSDLVRHGYADWVYYEELYDRNWKGYRWSPDSRHVAFVEYDDRAVGVHEVIDQTVSPQKVERTRYPKAGTTNPTVRLGVVAASGGPVRWVDFAENGLPGLPDLGREPGDGGGLLAHFGWFPGGEKLYAYVQDRAQSTLSARAVGVPAEGKLGPVKELFKETAGAWQQSPGDLEFLADGTFAVASTRDGWRHLYRYAPDGTFSNAVTEGDWEVRSVALVTDAENAAEQWIYFQGTKDSHVGENLYRVRPDGSDLARLTPDDGSHAASVAPGGGYFIDSWSNYETPDRVDLRAGDGEFIRTLGEAEPKDLGKVALGEYRWVEIGTRDGGTLYGYLLTPPGLDLENPDEQIPAWVMTYGGPHAPTVKDAWAGGRKWEQLLATNGIAVLRVDPRAASGRGWASAWAAHERLGEQETEDMLDAAAWLKTRPWCDGTLGLDGHSYGGYLTARVLTHGDAYAAGIAGGSVTAFANYDTIYTERLMDTPAANPGGYASTDLSKKAGDLSGRLLLAHGAIDDNVHVQNALQFAEALQQAGKEFELMLYPTSRHGIYSPHYRKLRWDFIRETMLGE